MIIQPISGSGYSVAQAAAVKESPAVQQPDRVAPVRPQEPRMDEYVPEAKAADGPKQKAADGKKAETCTANTDRADREIERLKKEKEQLEQRLNSETDEAKKKELEAKLSQIENELRQKDNDAYRRQHTVFS